MKFVCAACGAANRVPEDRLNDQPVCGRCGAELCSLSPQDVSDATLPAFLAHSEVPFLVDYWAPWCGPCQAMAPQYVQAAEQAPGVRFLKLDTDAHPRSAAAAGIRSIPTLVLYQNGRERARQSGAITSGALLDWLRRHLG